MEHDQATDIDLPIGVFPLSHGYVAVVTDATDEIATNFRTGQNLKCALTKLRLRTCGCWSCRGLKRSPLAPVK